MSSTLGTPDRPLRVAIIGAGPSAFYAAGALLGQNDVAVSVDMFDRLPAPYGLVRYGVAPDHQKIKNVVRVYERTAKKPGFRFFGNVDFGRDLTHDDVRAHYDQVIYAVGAQSDRKLGIPGEDLPGSYSATEFVAWYNGHPDFVDRTFDLSSEAAVVIGVGNVAMDVARILAKSVEELEETDICDYALDTLRESNIRTVYVLGRRGPAQAKFTPAEIREFGQLDVADAVVDAAQLDLDEASAASLEDDLYARKNMKVLEDLAENGVTGKPRRVIFRFLTSPVEILGDEDAGVTHVRVERNELRPTESGYIQSYGTGETEVLSAGLVLRSVGYRGVPLPGVPFNERRGTIPNEAGRVVDPETGAVVRGEYAVGWCKRGPSGVIGTNKPDAVESVEQALADVPDLEPVDADRAAPGAIPALLDARGVRYVTFADWQNVDRQEVERGAPLGKPRVKYYRVDEILEQCVSVADRG